ncbi:MAG: citramalate synthase [Bacillota bacterium]|nr:citramalate synthase [Bacillota bacterium]
MKNELKKDIEILDSTLRDGAQGEGISFSIEDKLHIVSALDELGVKYIEAGNPGSNPKDLEFFQRAGGLHLKHAILTAFGSTRRKGISVKDDSTIVSLESAGTSAICIFGKSWDFHVTSVICTTLEENLRMIEETLAHFASLGKEVIFDAEHFFDGYKANSDYALACLNAAVRGGASCLALCDTKGGSFPEEIFEATKAVLASFPVRVGIHCHNDGGLAVANSLAAVAAGAVHVQGTYLGFGERCGNANLCTIIANLQLKKGYHCIPDASMENLTAMARYIAEVSNVGLANTEPYVGKSAFAHKAGMHSDGVSKASVSFEHIAPEKVGNERRFLMSEMAGRAAVLTKINSIVPGISKESPQTQAIIKQIKELEMEGYQFEGADGSFELVVRKHLGLYRPFFELVNYKIIGEEPPVETGCSATATIKIRVDGQPQISAAEGDGPVHALDQALRRALNVFYPSLSTVHLTDYKVRVLEPKAATAAKVRVLIESSDGTNLWSTVGVSTDIIEASWKALVDSIEYKLLKDFEDK